jgi:hypothetical protein
MSVIKKDQVFPIKPRAISDAELAQIVADALRKDFGDTPSAIKHIGRVTNANLRAIKNWYEARNTPSSGHLLLLARSSPSILTFVLQQVGGEDLLGAFQLLKKDNNKPDSRNKNLLTVPKIAEKNFRIEVNLSHEITGRLNKRQLWFLTLLQQGEKAKTATISTQFPVTDRTARGDVAELVDLNLIKIVGSRKNGWYKSL